MRRDRFAVIGDPIDHSLSPVMHRAAFAAAGISASYEAVLVSPHDLVNFMDRLRQEFRGINVTIPHKKAVMTLLDDIAQPAQRVGAVNTVINIEGRLTGHNTDVPGFIQAVQTLEIDVRGNRALLIGTGGSARAIAHALVQMGCLVRVLSRETARAAQFAREVALPLDHAAVTDPDAPEWIHRAQLIVNTTPAGMKHLPDVSPLPPGSTFGPDSVVIDLVYGRQTPLLRAASAAGARTMDGLEMLVQQGAESFRLWMGVEPDIDVMRDACRHHLKEDICSVS